MISNYYWCEKFEYHSEKRKKERICWAKQALELANRDKTISNRKKIKSSTLPIFKEFVIVDFIFIAQVVISNNICCHY